MARNTEYQFVPLDADALESQLLAAYEELTGITVQPSSPERLFIAWVTSIIVQERALTNWAGNQNLPSRAEGANLDAIAELFYSTARPTSTPATCTMRFFISEAQTSAILIPTGTRVTDVSGALVWHTIGDIYIPIGATYIDKQVQCETVGTVGNDYEAGQINQIVDVFDYYDHCENITASANGTDETTDDDFYALLRTSQDAWSTAGPKDAYIYHAKRSNSDIADVVVASPSPGVVKLYALMEDGTAASSEVKQAIATACNADDVRPLTDQVSVEDPVLVNYNIAFTYYIPRNSAMSASDIQAVVNTAVDEFRLWQAGKLGRDINPSQLIQMLMVTGIKRVVLTEPDFRALADGTDGSAPELASLQTINITAGGYEDE